MIFSYDVESRSQALGQAGNGKFNSWNLQDPLDAGGMGYNNQHYSHSREFRSNIVAERKFWENVFDKCKFQR